MRVTHVRAADRVDLVHTQGRPGNGSLEALEEQPHRALADREQQIFLVAEIDVHQGARQTCAARHLVDCQRVPALLGIQPLGSVENLGAAALFFFLAANGYVGHGGMLCQH